MRSNKHIFILIILGLFFSTSLKSTYSRISVMNLRESIINSFSTDSLDMKFKKQSSSKFFLRYLYHFDNHVSLFADVYLPNHNSDEINGTYETSYKDANSLEYSKYLHLTYKNLNAVDIGLEYDFINDDNIQIAIGLYAYLAKNYLLINDVYNYQTVVNEKHRNQTDYIKGKVVPSEIIDNPSAVCDEYNKTDDFKYIKDYSTGKYIIVSGSISCIKITNTQYNKNNQVTNSQKHVNFVYGYNPYFLLNYKLLYDLYFQLGVGLSIGNNVTLNYTYDEITFKADYKNITSNIFTGLSYRF